MKTPGPALSTFFRGTRKPCALPAGLLVMAWSAMLVSCAEVTDPDPPFDGAEDVWAEWPSDWMAETDDGGIPDLPPDVEPDPAEDPALDPFADPDVVEDPGPDPDLVPDPEPDPDLVPDPEPDPDMPSDPDADDPVEEEAPPDPGTTCDTAIDITSLPGWTGPFSGFPDLWDGTTGCRSAGGREAWFTFTVADGHIFTVEHVSSTDVVFHIVDSCATTLCSWSSDEPERFQYYNETGGEVTFILVVERYSAGSTGTIQLSITDELPDPGYDCESAIDITSLPGWTGPFSDYGDMWDGTTGCRPAGGPEAWFTFTVADGHRFKAEHVSTTDVVFHVVNTCTTTLCSWSSDEPEIFEYYNDSGSDVAFILVVEKYSSGTTGTIQLVISDEVPDPGFDCTGPVDITSLSSWSGSFTDYADLWDGGSGCRTAYGAEAWFTATVQAGHRFIVIEESTTDTVLHRVASCGTTACLWSSDSPERYDWFNDTGSAVDVLLVVERYSSGSTGPLELSITNAAPPDGYSCDTPVDITALSSWTGSFADMSDLWDGSSGCRTAYGAEAWFTVTVQNRHRLLVEEESSTDVVMHTVDSCGSTTCTWSSDSPERLDWYNDTGSPATLTLVVERYASGSTGPLQLTISNESPPAGYVCDLAIDVTSPGAWSGSFTDYADLWDGLSGCRTAYGAEVWFTATLQDGHTFTMTETSATDTVLHRVASCGSTTCTWSSDMPESGSFTNTSGSPEVLYLIVEHYASGSAGDVAVTVTNGP
ncbi:MAG: hypothetical protein ABIJ56_14465 [Pseudomonadota bacterium]